MRSVRVDATESSEANGEEFLSYSIARRAEFDDLDQFFFATLDTGLYERDERWYAKRVIPASDVERLIGQVALRFVSESERLPPPAESGLVYTENWDDVDFAYCSAGHYVRAHWFTND